MNRASISPILDAIPAARQQDARHYGVHPYFTRRPANVVRSYIERYSFEGDVVLDPFGGTGVTAIEAMLLGRRAIHNDLNPFANFIARCIADTTLPSTLPMREAFSRVERACAQRVLEIERDETAARRWLKRVALPENIPLPRTSDAAMFHDLFTPRQLAGLALIKQSIEANSAGIVRDLLLLAWSASVAKLNRTFLSAKGRAATRGGSSIFSIYRYKLAAECVELPIWKTFAARFRNVLAAKEEVLKSVEYQRRSPKSRIVPSSERDFVVMARDAADLTNVIKPGSVDYIFTDPPYGAFISYLDLSVLWNHWLGFPVTREARARETIVGGEEGLSEEHYKKSLAGSIKTCLKLLRGDRWFSIVFQHWDTTYFETILDTATACGAELKAAITQTGDVIWSMHKKKNSASVLAGEMIITFYKPAKASRAPRLPARTTKCDNAAVLAEVLDACLANGTRTFTSEALFHRIVIEMWKRKALGCLALGRQEFATLLRDRGWLYIPRKHIWARSGDDAGGDSEPTLFETCGTGQE